MIVDDLRYKNEISQERYKQAYNYSSKLNYKSNPKLTKWYGPIICNKKEINDGN